MKQVKLLITIVCIVGTGFVFQSHATMPNFVKTLIYQNSDSISTSISYSDGLGRDLQTSLYLDANKARVAGTAYDEIGRPAKITVPFFHTTMSYIPDPVSAAHNDRNEDHPYSESKYKPDPLNRQDTIGAPGEDFSVDGTHFNRTWYMGTVRPETNQDYIDEWGFIFEDDAMLNNNALDNFEKDGVTASTPTYFLAVSKGPNDNSYMQEIKDKFGRTVSTCNMNGIRAEYTYDILGNLLKEFPPDSNYFSPRVTDDQKATLYQFNTTGQMIAKTTPDAGLVKYKYDATGQVIATQNSKQRATTGGCEYTVYLYDSLGRNYAIGINNTTTTFDDENFENISWSLPNIDLRILKIFDDPAKLAAVLGASYTPEYFASNFCTIENTQGKAVAEIVYQEKINSTFWNKVTVNIYSFTDEGRIAAKLMRIPRMNNFCMFTYSYNQQGNLIAYHYAKNDQGEDPKMDNMSYQFDRHGRMMTIKSTNSLNETNSLVDDVFDYYGLLDTRVFGYSEDHTSYTDKTQFNYNIRDWPTAMTSGKFSETNICYNTSNIDGTSLSQARYNGAISAIRYCYNVSGSDEYGINQYEYDLVNRLVNVYPDNTDYSSRDVLNYNNDGTISNKHRLQRPSGSPYFLGTYHYIPHSNKVHKITGTRTPSLSNDNNFIYDPNGNMVLDYSKKMYIEYDWRNMPVTFTFYNSIPNTIIQAADETARAALWQNLKQNIEVTATAVSEVKMVYGAGGNRVMKKEYKYYEP